MWTNIQLSFAMRTSQFSTAVVDFCWSIPGDFLEGTRLEEAISCLFLVILLMRYILQALVLGRSFFVWYFNLLMVM
jgi:nitrate reductase NapE component